MDVLAGQLNRDVFRHRVGKRRADRVRGDYWQWPITSILKSINVSSVVLSEITKSRDIFAFYGNSLGKHIERSYPNPSLTIERLVDRHPLFSLTVLRNMQKLVVITFVMSVFT